MEVEVEIARPAQPDMGRLDRRAVPCPEGRFHMVFEDWVAVLDGGREVDDIAYLEPLRLDISRQRTVERRRFEIGLTPQYRERLPVREHVDDLVATADLKLVDGDRVGRRLPDNRQISGIEPLRVLDLERGFAV